MPSPKTYLITGANRGKIFHLRILHKYFQDSSRRSGLGRGLLEALVQRPNTVVIAGVRNLTHSTCESLKAVPTGAGSKVIAVVIRSTDERSAKEAVAALQSEHGISKIDTVIANAGISNYYGSADITPISEVRDHFEINAVGTLLLFQATWPLLKLSSNPIFMALSTGVASIGAMGGIPLQATAYGMSKIAVNYMVQKIHFENPDIIAFTMNPG